MANRCTALATAVGVVAGVHDGTTAAGTDAHVALTASLAEVDVLVVDVGDLTDDCGAVDGHVAHLARGQTDQSVAVLLSHQLSHVASGTDQLSAAAGVQLDVVDDGTEDVYKRQDQLETIEEKIRRDRPLPMPLSSICSPHQVIS